MALENTRREILKKVGAVSGASALGSLTGCTGGSDGGAGTPADGGAESGGGSGGAGGAAGGSTDTEGSGESTQTQTDGGGGTETVEIRFLSGLAAETNATRDHMETHLSRFEEMQGNVTVNLSVVSYSDLGQKIGSTVNAGNAPDLAEAGAAGIQFFLSDQVVDHGSYIEEAEGIPDNWTGATKEAARYRGEWWSAAQNRQGTTMLTVRPSLFKEVGVETPDDIASWTDFRQAVEQIDEQFDDTWAFEATGAPADLESYWGEARTAYTDGEDPWIRGDPTDPTVLIGEEDRTDGMIKNTIDLSKTYSSAKSASRVDEEIPPLLLTDQVASMTSGLATAQRWRSAKSDVTFGWDGDVWMGPNPKLDPNYGEEFGIEELAGLEGQHGGHAWALLTQKQVFANSDNPDVAFELAKFTNTDQEFIVPLVGKVYTSIPSYRPYMDSVLSEYELTQIHTNQIEAAQQYGPQYSVTGAAWDLENTNPIRWTSINETISQAMAGQHTIEETPGLIRERVMQRL